MTDSSKNNQPPSPKTLSNSLRLKSPANVKNRQNVSNILNRLPFLRNLSETQNHLLSITPIWQQWCTDQASPAITEFASLASIDNGVLTIKCTQSSTATILKHQQSNLLDTIKQNGFTDVSKIRIQMSLKQENGESSNESSETKNILSPETKWNKPSASSLKSIEATQSLIKNEQLAASLQRLAETLKNTT